MPVSRHPSKAFQRFSHAFFEPLTYEEWRNGFDIPALIRLSAEEKLRAEDLLFQELEKGSTDARIVIGLGELRSQRALPLLKERVQSSRGERSVLEPALACWQIARSPEALSALIEALATLPDYMGRMDAAINLRECPYQEAAQVLQQALSDEAYLVRYHATNSLLTIHGLWPHLTRGHALAIKMMSEEPQKREAALKRLRSMIADRTLPRLAEERRGEVADSEK